MKKIILILIFFTFSYTFSVEILLCNPLLDTTSAKYIPLAVGNVYKYHYSSSGGFNYDHQSRIIGDTLIGSKKYFKMTGFNSGLYRYDSVNGNLNTRSDFGYCSYSPHEVIVDSLASRKGDSTKNCYTSNYNTRYCTDTVNITLFGIIVKSKSFTQHGFEGAEYVTYARGFGYSSYTYIDLWGMSTEFLVGCYINVVLYGDTTLVDITNLNTQIPDKFSLYQNYPNPFNPITKIKFDIPAENKFPLSKVEDAPGRRGLKGVVSLNIYDITGREIQTLVNEKLNPGTYEVMFDGSNLSSGIYFYQLRSGEFVETKKLILLK
jgi:hypothetical protein